MKPCDCLDWRENIDKVNGPIVLQSIRAGRDLYTGKPFVYCPWCGRCLLEQNECRHPRIERRTEDGLYQCHECFALMQLQPRATESEEAKHG